MAEKMSIFLIGLLIYLSARLIGFAFEKSFVNRVKGLWKLNRLGGAFLGGLKSTIIIAIVFFFVALVPPKMVKKRFPKLLTSHTYQMAARNNPMVEQNMLERMRLLRTTVLDPKKNKHLKDHPDFKKLFSKYKLKSAMNDKRFVRALEEGDFDKLRENEQVEELMQDDQLTSLLAALDAENR